MQWRVKADGLAWTAMPDDAAAGISLRFERITEGRGELRTDLAIIGPRVRRREYHINVLSGRTLETLGKSLGEDWTALLRGACSAVIEAIRVGEPGWDVDVDTVSNLPLPYLIEPILPLGQPTILYGPAGVSKSYLALALSMSVAIGRTVVPGMIPTSQAKVLYLDYEMTEREFGMRLRKLAYPLALKGRLGVRRLFMSRPIADDAVRIDREMSESDASLLVIDPAGPAMGAGSDFDRDDMRAERMFSALRSFGRTSLVVDHVTKVGLRNSRDAAIGPIGTVVKYNRARSVWEVRKSEETSQGQDVVISMRHVKANDAPVGETRGLRVTHATDAVTFATADFGSLGDAVLSAPAAVQISAAIQAAGKALTPAEITEESGLKDGTVRVTLRRMATDGRLVMVGDHRYGIPAMAYPKGRPS